MPAETCSFFYYMNIKSNNTHRLCSWLHTHSPVYTHNGADILQRSSLIFASHPHLVFQVVFSPQVSSPMHIFSPPYVPHAPRISFLISSTEWYMVRITNHYAVYVISVVGRVALGPVCLQVIRFYLFTYPEGWKFDAWAHCTLQTLAPDGDRTRGIRLSLCLVKLRAPQFLSDVSVLDSVYIP